MSELKNCPFCGLHLEHMENSYKNRNGNEVEDFAKDYQYYESLLAILSRARIRETATEPPTREDAGQFNGLIGMIAARNRHGESVVKHWQIIAENPSNYPLWTCVADYGQLPEVTPPCERC